MKHRSNIDVTSRSALWALRRRFEPDPTFPSCDQQNDLPGRAIRRDEDDWNDLSNPHQLYYRFGAQDTSCVDRYVA